MKTLAVVLAAALAVALPTAAYAAPAASSADEAGTCESLLKTPVPCAIWALKCIGDALGGNACHDDAPVAAAAVDACAPLSECLEPAVRVVRCVGDALNGHACHGYEAEAAAGPDVEKVVACAKSAARQIVNGVTPMPCDV